MSSESPPHIQTLPYKILPNNTSLLADIYTCTPSPNSPQLGLTRSPVVVLFFHAGGLTAFSRKFINASVVQAALSRNWTFVSVDYRLLPQATGEEIWEDGRDAYDFVARGLPGRGLNVPSAEDGRDSDSKIIVSGASAGSYLAFLLARHHKALSPPPTALLSYYGIPSFSTPFFNMNHIIWGTEPQPLSKFSALLKSKEIYTGYTSPSQSFSITSLNPDLSPNKSYEKPTDEPEPEVGDVLPRPDLYDYYVQENLYLGIFSGVEKEVENGPGFPKCVLLHGTDDPDGPLGLSAAWVKEVGDEKATLVRVEGKGHCFDNGFFLDDEGVEMEGVRKAWGLLDGIVKAADVGR